VIRSVRANGVDYPFAPHLVLPRGTSDLQIDYTALSLSIPERVRFQYKLEGSDKTWIDPAERRQAFYTRLGPGDYHFQVRAANNDGVWNTGGVRTCDSPFRPPSCRAGRSWFFACSQLSWSCGCCIPCDYGQISAA